MSGRRALDAALLCLLVAVGCSAIVEPRNPEPFCTQGDSGAQVCPQGLACVDGRCTRACGPEVCMNNIDDDCDGRTDEEEPRGRDTCGDKIDNDCDGVVDEGSDFDQDGYTWCGDTASADAGRNSVDCDDRLASVHPGLPETCDGQDNDCDGKVDEDNEGEALCSSSFVCVSRCVPLTCANDGPRLECADDERCDVATGQCVPRACGGATCSDREYCDMVANTCRTRPPMPNGARCESAADCTSGSCIDGASLRLAAGGRVCGQACCDDRNCPEGQRCFASGTGARSCLPSAQVPSTTPIECVTDDACQLLRVCGLDRGQSFGPPQFVSRSSVITSNCVLSAPPLTPVGDACATFAQCSTRVCVPGQFFGSVCSNPCGTSKDCGTLDDKVGGKGAYCRYVDVTLDTSPTDYAAVCVVRQNETGQGTYGTACASGADCLEGGCVEATSTKKGRCTTTCCTDSQCGTRGDGEPIRCRPYAFGDRYEMRCEI